MSTRLNIFGDASLKDGVVRFGYNAFINNVKIYEYVSDKIEFPCRWGSLGAELLWIIHALQNLLKNKSNLYYFDCKKIVISTDSLTAVEVLQLTTDTFGVREELEELRRHINNVQVVYRSRTNKKISYIDKLIKL